jgi:hypothetical protein
MGLGALVFFLTMLLALLQGLWRIAREDDGWWRLTALATMFCLVAFCGIMLTSFPLQMPSRASFFWTTVAAALGLIAAFDHQRGRAAEATT